MTDRFRLFSIILYEDSDSYNFNDVIKNIKGYKYWAYIKHDKDKLSSNDNLFKKIHYHVVLRTDNAVTLKSISKKIGISENYIQHIRNERAYLRYLIHFDDDDKYQYDFDNIVVSRSYKSCLCRAFDDYKTEEEKIDEIFNFINEHNNLSYIDFMRLFITWLNVNCYYTIYNRYRKEFNNMLNFLK